MLKLAHFRPFFIPVGVFIPVGGELGLYGPVNGLVVQIKKFI